MILEIFGKTLKFEIGERPVLIYNENALQKEFWKYSGKHRNQIKNGGRPVLIYNENAPRK